MRKVPELAAKLGMSVPATWRLIYSGAIPFVKIGKSVRVRDEHIEQYIRANTHQAGRAAQFSK